MNWKDAKYMTNRKLKVVEKWFDITQGGGVMIPKGQGK